MPDSSPAEKADAGPDADADALPAPAQDNIELIAELAEREDAKVGRLRAAIEHVSAFFGTPAYFVAVVFFIGLWIAVNLWGRAHAWSYYDEPPFFWLQGFVSSNALLLTISVLIRQDRMAELATHRAHLDLQINMLTERKVAKTLELVEQFRRERSQTRDAEVDELTKPADPEAILGAIKRGNDAPVS